MPPVDTEGLIDAHGVAKILGLSHATSVGTYFRRYHDMPMLVVDLDAGRPRLSLRSEIEEWPAVRSGGENRRAL